MLRLGYHASHEQFPPEDLVECARRAEAAGFDAIMSSDHFYPWSPEQGHSGHVWSWLGAAMQTTQLPFGAITIPGGWRFHPAMIAQAAATLARMFPGRLAWLAAGSGEALNEHIVGAGWPSKPERNARLREGVEIIRALWDGETVSRNGPIPTDHAKLYTRAKTPPKLFCAALSLATAEWAGTWADGLITINQSREQLQKIVDAFRRGGGAGKPLALQFHLSYARSDAEARDNAHRQWRSNAIPAAVTQDLRMPEDFAALAERVRPEEMDEHVCISADPAVHADRIESYAQIGFSEIYLHNVGRNQHEFIAAFGSAVLPRLRASVQNP